MEGRIRVSVVATGIDASSLRGWTSVARWSMAAPLTLTPSHQTEAPRASIPVPTHAAPAPMQMSMADDEADLDDEPADMPAFDAMASRAGMTAAAPAPMLADDLPPPA